MNKQNPEIEKINENKIWFRNFSISILLHLFLILLFFYLYDLKPEASKINSEFFTIDTKQFSNVTSGTNDESGKADEELIKEQKELENKSESGNEIKSVDFSDLQADTTNLDQIYSEKSLNVKIKYPKGWTFIDQHKKNKLDGVTFWSSDGIYNPPPFIHFEVVNKDLFLEKRYKYKSEFENYTAYYNDPEELEGYLTLIVYLRTDEEEDYRLKLMMKGETEFYSFKPRFWAILKSFSFGDSIF
ncbi:MAG TPA: hypothetical protein VF270_09940 [Ignavibacteriaceae bacterium]